MAHVQNPILPGFHPDPCIIRVDDTFYIATSTFEWWPGVRIHRSRDLIQWELAGHALTRESQLALQGTPASGGVWAPSLSYADGLFWLVYSDVKAFNGCSKDVWNYLVTAPSVTGPWSEPIYLNRSGFDPSLFHDSDGRKWMLNQIWDTRPDRNQFAGISLQEYDAKNRRLVGEAVNIFRGSSLGITEGPHLYQRFGYYFLVVAEGGTGEAHAVTVARSRQLFGPYEVSPHNPLLTAVGDPNGELQKAGHGSFVQTQDGYWYMAHLCSRPIGKHRRCILGRETALQEISWPEGDWPRLAAGGRFPKTSVEISVPAVTASYLNLFHDDFSAPELNSLWATLREPARASWLSLSERAGSLRLRGRQTLLSCFAQSLVGFRLLQQRCRTRVTLDFNPVSFQQSAGLAFYYNTSNFHYLMITGRDGGGRELRFLCGDNGSYANPFPAGIRLADTGPIELAAELDGETLQFFFAEPDGMLRSVGPKLDATLLSDDRVIEGGAWGFTGTFIALCAQDSSDRSGPADFSDFFYKGYDLNAPAFASETFASLAP